jgi:hypothetical protein
MQPQHTGDKHNHTQRQKRYTEHLPAQRHLQIVYHPSRNHENQKVGCENDADDAWNEFYVVEACSWDGFVPEFLVGDAREGVHEGRDEHLEDVDNLQSPEGAADPYVSGAQALERPEEGEFD